MRREGTKWRALIGSEHHVECEHVDPHSSGAVEWESGGGTDRTSRVRWPEREWGFPPPTTQPPVRLSSLCTCVYVRMNEDRRGRTRDPGTNRCVLGGRSSKGLGLSFGSNPSPPLPRTARPRRDARPLRQDVRFPINQTDRMLNRADACPSRRGCCCGRCTTSSTLPNRVRFDWPVRSISRRGRERSGPDHPYDCSFHRVALVCPKGRTTPQAMQRRFDCLRNIRSIHTSSSSMP